MESTIPALFIDTVRSLPPFPAAIRQLFELTKNHDADFQQFARVIEADQILTARTISAANATLYGSNVVRTVRQAVMQLGQDIVRDLAVSASEIGLQSDLNDRWPADVDSFWRHTLGVALLARGLAAELGNVDPEEAFVAGLLHDIGKTVMLDHFGNIYGQVLLAAAYGTDPLHTLEQQVFGTDHTMVGQALCLLWNIPAEITSAIADHHNDQDLAPQAIVEIVKDANELVKLFPFSDAGNRFVCTKCSRPLPHTMIKPDRLRVMIVNLTEKVREVESAYGNTSSESDCLKEMSSIRPIVYVQVEESEEQDMLVMMLLALGYEPVLMKGARDFLDAKRGTAPLQGFIIDRPLAPDYQRAVDAVGIPVLDFSEWRSSSGHLIHPGYYNVVKLRKWLLKGLQGQEG